SRRSVVVIAQITLVIVTNAEHCSQPLVQLDVILFENGHFELVGGQKGISPCYAVSRSDAFTVSVEIRESKRTKKVFLRNCARFSVPTIKAGPNRDLLAGV